MGVAEPRQHRAGRGRPERFDQFPSQQAERDGVEDQHALAAERNEPAFGRKVKQFMNVEIGRAHQGLRLGIVKMIVETIISIVVSLASARQCL
jgi:hypothetical protein